MLYSITDWYGKVHKMTARALYTRIMEDSKSDYNWLTSATELVRVCSLHKFPEKYAREIKMAILNCFANVSINRDIWSTRLTTDDDAVYSCYNSLSNKDNEAFKIKKKYLTAIITEVSVSHFDTLTKLSIPMGTTYEKIRTRWIKKKINQNIYKPNIDFKQLIKDLHEDFDKTINWAISHKVLKDDEQVQKEELTKMAKLIVDAGKEI